MMGNDRQQRRGSRPGGRSHRLTQLLKELDRHVRTAVDAKRSLEELPGFRFDQREISLFDKFVRSVLQSGKLALEGGDRLSVEKTEQVVAKARAIAERLPKIFEVFMSATPARFKRMIAQVNEIDRGVIGPAQLARISDSERKLMELLARPKGEVDYEEIVAAYKEGYYYLKNLSRKATFRNEVTSIGDQLLSLLDEYQSVS